VSATVAVLTVFVWFVFPRLLHEVEEQDPSGDG
jgi:hypothetical protein